MILTIAHPLDSGTFTVALPPLPLPPAKEEEEGKVVVVAVEEESCTSAHGMGVQLCSVPGTIISKLLAVTAYLIDVRSQQQG